jgi:hypothetical protein
MNMIRFTWQTCFFSTNKHTMISAVSRAVSVVLALAIHSFPTINISFFASLEHLKYPVT